MAPEPIIDLASIDWTHIVADREAIRRFNPQRHLFEQLDAVVHLDPSRHLMIGYKDVRADEFWVSGHMPEYPLMPGVLMCEAAAQLCSYYIRSRNLMPGDYMGFGGMNEFRFRCPVYPGQRLVIVGQASKVHRRQTICHVQGFVGTTMAFHGDIIGVAINRPGAG
jgi:3-hydroxyacyl-[acyl-carrier-protein] dehydratase